MSQRYSQGGWEVCCCQSRPVGWHLGQSNHRAHVQLGTVLWSSISADSPERDKGCVPPHFHQLTQRLGVWEINSAEREIKLLQDNQWEPDAHDLPHLQDCLWSVCSTSSKRYGSSAHQTTRILFTLIHHWRVTLILYWKGQESSDGLPLVFC